MCKCPKLLAATATASWEEGVSKRDNAPLSTLLPSRAVARESGTGSGAELGKIYRDYAQTQLRGQPQHVTTTGKCRCNHMATVSMQVTFPTLLEKTPTDSKREINGPCFVFCKHCIFHSHFIRQTSDLLQIYISYTERCFSSNGDVRCEWL